MKKIAGNVMPSLAQSLSPGLRLGLRLGLTYVKRNKNVCVILATLLHETDCRTITKRYALIYILPVWSSRMPLKRSEERLLMLIRFACRSCSVRVLARPTRLSGRVFGACRAPCSSHARSSFFHRFSALLQHIADSFILFHILYNSACRLLDCYP